MLRAPLLVSLLGLLPTVARSAPAQSAVQAALCAELDRHRQRLRAPGLTAAVVAPDGEVLAVAVGLREEGRAAPLEPGDRLFCGSIGKTWFAAVIHRLVAAGRLSLDDRIGKHLGDEPWFERLPNHDTITVRHLMRHQSGLPRWIEAEGVWTAIGDAQRGWRNGDQLAFVFDRQPVHAAGAGWAYSDTNYIVLGLIVEKLIGTPIYDAVREQLLVPHALRDTIAATGRRIPGLVQGQARMFGRFGIPERVLVDGQLVFDPAFEWCGGGFVTTASDLARWARLYGSGHASVATADAAPRDMTGEAVDAVGLGKGTRYGLGIMLHDSPLGPMRGHDGVFLGYSASMAWFAEHDIGVAVLANVDDAGFGLRRVLIDLAGICIAAPEGGGRDR